MVREKRGLGADSCLANLEMEKRAESLLSGTARECTLPGGVQEGNFEYFLCGVILGLSSRRIVGAGAGHPEPVGEGFTGEAESREIAKPAMPPLITLCCRRWSKQVPVGTGKGFEFVVLIDICKGCVYDLKGCQDCSLPKSRQKNCETA